MVVITFGFGQMLLIDLGWRAALNSIAISFPENLGWLATSLIRDLGAVIGLLCILYPVYFGFFGLGLRIRQLNERQRINPTRNAALGD